MFAPSDRRQDQGCDEAPGAPDAPGRGLAGVLPQQPWCWLQPHRGGRCFGYAGNKVLLLVFPFAIFKFLFYYSNVYIFFYTCFNRKPAVLAFTASTKIGKRWPGILYYFIHNSIVIQMHTILLNKTWDIMEIATFFLYLNSYDSSDAELDWCTGRQDWEPARDSATSGVCRRDDDLVMPKFFTLPNI